MSKAASALYKLLLPAAIEHQRRNVTSSAMTIMTGAADAAETVNKRSMGARRSSASSISVRYGSTVRYAVFR